MDRPLPGVADSAVSGVPYLQKRAAADRLKLKSVAGPACAGGSAGSVCGRGRMDVRLPGKGETAALRHKQPVATRV
jgi:hypothetical protein